MIRKYITIIDTFKNYEKSNFKSDFIAGLTVAIMLIPQGMAYAMLAGLPPIIGLYSSFIPLIIYAFFGTSRQLAVGPVAIDSLLVASGVAALHPSSTNEYVALAVILSILVGAIQFIMGALKFGFLVEFLSNPVIKGFTSAAALIIGLSQLKHLLGINIPRSSYIHEVLINAFSHISEVNIPTLTIGIFGIITLKLIKKYKPILPGALIVVALSTLAVWLLNLNEIGVKIVGEIPEGLPKFAIPSISIEKIKLLFPVAITISLVAFMEAISIAKTFAIKNKYSIDSNQELISLGLSNLIGSFFSTYPVTGGFSRTAVNAQAGSKTTIASLITATFVGLTLMFFTSLLYFLPNAILASIIMVAVFGLIDLKELTRIFSIKKIDGFIWITTFLATLSLGISKGIMLGVTVSLLYFIYKSSKPEIIISEGNSNELDGTKIIRIDSSLYFANLNYIKENLINITENDKNINKIILDFSSINQIDSAGVDFLFELFYLLENKGIEISFSNIKEPIFDIINKTSFLKLIGKDKFYNSNKLALHNTEK